MGKRSYESSTLDRARDELFSHIRRCGVLEAEQDQRGEWFDDTVEYLAERYPQLSPDDLTELRAMGERYCGPAIRNGGTDAAEDEASEPSDDEEEAIETGEVSAA